MKKEKGTVWTRFVRWLVRSVLLPGYRIRKNPPKAPPASPSLSVSDSASASPSPSEADTEG